MTNKMVDGVVVPLTEEEEAEFAARSEAWAAGALDRALGRLRQERDQKLSACDWVVLDDVAFSNEVDTQWRTYRQDLRDITDGLTTEDQVNAVVWPTPPS